MGTKTHYVYEYVLVERNKAIVRAVVHRADCRWCNDGRGHPRNAGRKRGVWKWHGPFATTAEARALAQQIGGSVLSCGWCDPLGHRA